MNIFLVYYTINNENKELVSGSVYYQCEFCDYKIKEVYKRDMLIKGQWISDNPRADFPSYRLNALQSPFISWEDVVKKYLFGLRDRQEMKAFVNTYLGEIYVEEAINLVVTINIKEKKKSYISLLIILNILHVLIHSIEKRTKRLLQ